MEIPKTMRAAQVVAYKKPLEIREVPVPKPTEEGQILVKLEVSGVCHTDLHVQAGDWDAKCEIPMTPGHEGVGVVAQLGPGVKELKVGDRVCVPWLHKSCRKCKFCMSGWETVCASQLRTGFSVHGTFAEYCLAFEDFVGKLPLNISNLQSAPIACAGVTVYKALKVSEVQNGETVVIVGGAGGLGHVAIQYAKSMGMKVIAVDSSDEKCAYMLQKGATYAVNAMATDKTIKERVMEYTDNLGADGAVILVPKHELLEEAVTYVRPLGIVVAVALPPGHFKVDCFSLVLNATCVKGSIVGTPMDLSNSLLTAASGEVHCDVGVRCFEDVNEVMERLAAGKIRGRVALAISDAAKEQYKDMIDATKKADEKN